MEKTIKKIKEITILFAGDSGDGIQLTGNEFSHSNALFGNDLATFPDYPAEIRAPQGTVNGVSGYRMKFGSELIYTPGDTCDVLVVMNAASLKKNIHNVRKGGLIIANESGFDAKNLGTAGYEKNESPLNELKDNFQIITLDVLKLTKEALKEYNTGPKEANQTKNMFVLGFILWLFGRSLESTKVSIQNRFSGKDRIIEINNKALQSGYNYGITSEDFAWSYEINAAPLPSGNYRNIMGNQALAIGLIVAADRAGLTLFYGSYPITPASDILHELARHKNFGVLTYQAEDEIAAISASIGASFGGNLGVTASSGPGIALKTEAIGLAVMLELPLVIINVQRGGPSTGLPTKTEQSDLLQAIYGRNGEAPLPVIAASSPADCFETAIEAARIALEHMTPVVLLSDGYLANGSEPWKYPLPHELPIIKTKKTNQISADTTFLPYKRDANLVRNWVVPGTPGMQHRIGGLEKEDETGNVSYDADNHEKMVLIRAKKVANIALTIPPQKIALGNENAQVAIVSWGSTYGVCYQVTQVLLETGYDVAMVHLKYLNPFPENLENLLKSFGKVVVPELNNGQLVKIIREKYLIDALPFNKIKGEPFSASELTQKIVEQCLLLSHVD